jgi:hypothetical protein
LLQDDRRLGVVVERGTMVALHRQHVASLAALVAKARRA